ncbi:hypothetical protein XENOCAPTIV_001682, partial [Xenoophorus captivus]
PNGYDGPGQSREPCHGTEADATLQTPAARKISNRDKTAENCDNGDSGWVDSDVKSNGLMSRIYANFTLGLSSGPGQYPNYPQGQGQQYGGYRPPQPGPPQGQQQRPYGYDQGLEGEKMQTHQANFQLGQWYMSRCILHLHICVALLRFSGITPSPHTTLLLHSWLPHPSQLPLGLPLARALGRAGVLGAPPPVLPGSCCPQLRSCRRYWGRTKSLLLRPCVRPLWEDEEVARRLLAQMKDS